VRKAALERVIAQAMPGIRFNEHLEHEDGPARLSSCVQAGAGRRCVETLRLGLCFGSLPALDQKQEFRWSGCASGSRGGLGAVTATTLVFRAATGFALLLLGVGLTFADSSGRYAGYGNSAYLTYLNAPGPLDDIKEVPFLRISFGERSYGVMMDTGSTGVVVSADKIPNINRLQSLGPGTLTYSSSGRIMTGQWVVTPMTITGGNGTRVTTAPIPVLAVNQVQCMEGARGCTPNEAPSRIAMLGIGFARRHDHQRQSGPDRNPFLNIMKLEEGDSNVERTRRGYIVTWQGIHIGLTSANTQGNFSYIKLVPEADGKDWAATPACFSVNRAKPAACGSLLMDTGVTTMYLTVPDSQAPADLVTGSGRDMTLVNGTNLMISTPTEDSPQALYSFTVGDNANPLAPASLTLVSRTRAPFVNTSLHFLNGFDYLYDADGGFVGFRWTGRVSQGFSKVVPVSPSN